MRKIIIILFLGILFVPAFAQEYAPKKGNIQAGLLLGNSMFYPGTNYMYMGKNDYLIGGFYHWENPSVLLKITDLNNNSLVNMIGAEFSYFVTDQIAVSFVGAGLVNHTPSRDFQEGVKTNTPVTGWDFIPDYANIEAELTTRLVGSFGVNYRLKVGNDRISPYVGINGTFQFAQLSASTTYIGIQGELEANFGVRTGQTFGWSPALSAGIEYSITPGLILGLEIKPFSFYYSGVELFAQPGLNAMTFVNKEFSFLSQPRLKLGFRF